MEGGAFGGEGIWSYSAEMFGGKRECQKTKRMGLELGARKAGHQPWQWTQGPGEVWGDQGAAVGLSCTGWGGGQGH